MQVAIAPASDERGCPPTGHIVYKGAWEDGCSLVNTLRFQRRAFGRKKLTKGPDVIRQACCPRWRALSPARTKRAVVCALAQRQRPPQAHGRSGHMVKGLEADHSLPQALTLFAEAGRLAHQRCQRLPHGQVQPFDQGCTHRQAQGSQALGSKHDAGPQCPQCALLLLFDSLPGAQIRLGLPHGLAGAPPLPGARTRCHDVAGSDERRQLTREAVAEERRHPHNAGPRGRNDRLRSVACARPHHRRNQQPTCGGKAAPDPLPLWVREVARALTVPCCSRL
jgi:hypothetical protein